MAYGFVLVTLVQHERDMEFISFQTSTSWSHPQHSSWTSCRLYDLREIRKPVLDVKLLQKP